MVYRTIILAALLSLAFVQAWAQATAGREPGFYAGHVTGTNNYTGTSLQRTFQAVAGRVFCGTFDNGSTANSTLQVDGQPPTPLPINVQYGQSVTQQAGSGDIPGGGTSLCLQINATASAWIKQTQIPGGILRLTTAHTVTPFEWSTGYTYVFTSAPATLTFPLIGPTTLSANGGVTLVATVPVTLQPTGANTINGQASAQTSPGGVTSLITLNNAGNGLVAPIGQVSVFPLSWGPNKNMAEAPIPLVTRTGAATILSITCLPGGLTPANSQLEIRRAPANTNPTNIQAGTGGTTTLGTSCDTSTGPGVTQPLLSTATPLAANETLWVVGSGPGWGGGAATLAGISGKIQVEMVP